MLFNSLHFLIYFPVVFFLFYRMPQRWRWALLLAASLYFYMCWKPVYVLLLLACVACNFVAARAIAGSARPGVRKAWLWLALLVSFGSCSPTST